MPLNKAAFEQDAAHVTINKDFEQHKAEVLARLREELSSDPKGIEYAGKSAVEIAKLLNEPYVVMGDETPRFIRLFLGVPYVNNIVTPEEIEAALEA